MKVTVFVCVGIFMSAQLLLATPGYSQDYEKKIISLNYSHVSIKTIFGAIEKKAGVVIMYMATDDIKSEKTSVSLKDKTVKEVLDQLLHPEGIQWDIRGNIIRLYRDKNNSSGIKSSQSLSNNQQEPSDHQQPIHGRVTDSTGAPLAGASVKVKGTPTGTNTNSDGEFTIDVNKGDWLVVSFVGYQPREVLVTSSYIQVMLSASTSSLDEVQIIAYGVTTKRLSTGNISTIKREEIQKQPVSNPLLALQGRVPGLFIQSNSGLPGGAVTVQLHGLNSIAAGTLPLYVIDGIPFTNSTLDQLTPDYRRLDPLNNINPADIESIEILKDADATAIYGSRGANGVILISTKKGNAGKTNFEINLYRGIGKISNYIDLLSTPDYIRMRKLALQLDGVIPDNSNAPDLELWDSIHTTNWQKLLLGGTSNITDIQVSLSGGSAQTRFMASGGYRKEGYVYPGDHSDRRMNSRLSLDHSSVNKKFTMSMTASYLVDENDLIAYDLVNYVNLPPNFPAYDSLGQLYWGGGKTNPLSQVLNKSSSRTNNFISNALLKYSLLTGLDIKVSMGYTQTDMYQVATYPKTVRNPTSTSMSYSRFADNHINTWIAEPQLYYTRLIKRSRLSLLTGMTWQQTLTNGQALNANNYTSDDLLESLGSAGTITAAGSNYAKYRYNSWFGRINYLIDDRYIFNVNYRRDGSSRFGTGNKWGNFGSAGIAWMFSAASFVKKHLPVLSYGKLRSSYGLTGNDQIPDYEFIPAYRSTQYNYQSGGLYQFRIGNPVYSWESNRKLEAAIDLGFFHDRLLITASYYHNRSGSQLVDYPLAGQTGFSNYRANLPAVVVNKGWEFMLISVNYKTKRWEWTSTFNLTLPKNKLASFERLQASSYATSLVIGQPLSLTWGLHATGIDPATGAPVFADLDGSGNINYPADFVYMKSSLPRFYGGLGNTVRYGRFGLDILFQFVKKTSRGLLYSWYRSPGTSNNISYYVWNNSWKKPGDASTMPRPSSRGTASNAYLNFIQSDAEALRDASYIRLNNLQLSYTLAPEWLHKMKLESCNLFLQGRNLFTITSYEGFDPETSSAVSQPNLRVITVGINCKF